MQTSILRVFKVIAANYNVIRNVRMSSLTDNLNTEQTLKTWKDIPGPSSLPIIGQLRHFLPGGSLHGSMGIELQDQLYRQYGPIVRLEGLLGVPDILFLYDAEGISQILHGENSMPMRPALMFLEYYKKVYSANNDNSSDKTTGLLTDHNEVWKKLRTTVNPILLKPNTIKLYSNIIDEVALDMVARLKSLLDDKNMIKSSFDVEMNLWALESIGVVALGGRLNCLDPNLPKNSTVRKLIEVQHEIFSAAENLDFKPSLWRYITTPAFKRAMKAYEELHVLSEGFIVQAMDRLQRKNQKVDEEKGILEKLLEIDVNVAVIIANDMLFAGIDTTSNTVTSILYFLAANPEKQNKLREEIISKQGRKVYLKACIKESLRIRPIIRGNVRKLSKEYNILGYIIPKDTYIIIAQQTLSTMEDQYPRPHAYIPERWLVGKDDPLYHGSAHPHAYGPFGFGSRSCIGRRIAELDLETFVTRMIENFRIEWFGPPLKNYATLLNYTAPPYNFTFKDLKST